MSQEQLIDLETKQLGLLKKIIKQHMPDKTVWAYGSRVNWKANETSDLDLTVFDSNSMEISALKEALEESNLLISVDIMNWEEIPENFRDNIKNKYVVLQAKLELEGWREVKLGDVAEITRGGSPRPIHDYITLTGTPWVKIADATATNSRYITKTKEFIKPEGESKSRIVYAGDFIVSNSATPGLPRFMKIRACIHDGWLLFREIKNIDKMFLYYLILKERESILIKGSGTIFTNLKTDILKSHIVSLPPLPEQKAIAEVLSSLDDKIDLLQRQNKTLEDMAQTLFRQWFIEEADEGWEKGFLSDLIEVKYGKDHKKLVGGNIPVYGSGGIMRYAEKALFEKESVLIPRKGSLNNVTYINEPFWAIDTMFYTRMKKPNLAKFIYHFVKAKDLASMNVGSAVPSMTTQVLNTMPLLIPSDIDFDRFENAVSPSYLKIKSNNSKISTLENLRDTLLPKLMSGEVKL